MDELKFKAEMTKQHTLQHQITIECEGNELHGKSFYREIVTPKNKVGQFGQAKTYYFFASKTEIYNTVEELLKEEFDYEHKE